MKRMKFKLIGKICFSGLLALAFIGAGCQQVRSDKEDLLAVEPNVAALVLPGDYATDAIKATGGLDAWTKTIKTELDGVVTFYQQDGSLYLTEHHFEVYPWSNSIRISAQEPQANFIWQLTAGQSLVTESQSQAIKNDTLSVRDYTEAVLMILTAPVRFFDTDVGFVKSPALIRKEGLRYYQIEQMPLMKPITVLRQTQDGEQSRIVQTKGKPEEERVEYKPYWSKVVLFQNENSGLVDMIWLAIPEQDKFLAVRGYDYKAIRQDGILVPSKIEIYRADNEGFIKERLVKIDFKNLSS
jgi:hypothetical protein